MTDQEAAKRWQRIEELFRGAVELPEDERAEFLDAATGDDPELRREVDELLEADGEADDFITGAVRAGEELLTQSAEALPPKFGKYEVESRLGEGGFGVVYRGRDPMLDRPVAIKACSSSDAGMRKRFYREARIAAGLRHSNITTVHELGVEDGVPFIVQELLEGEDLRQILGEERRLPLATAVSYLVQIARGLEHAHGAGVLHRDVKPANVRIQPDGSVKLMDFGIAKVLGADTGLTGTGMTLGTVGYLAPEQLRSEEVDERADIFAFGVLAYELLGQRRPFVGGDFSQVSYQLLYVEPPSLKKRWPGCPQSLADLVHRCLHKDKLERPGSMVPVRRMLEDVHRSLEGKPDTWIEAAGGEISSGSSLSDPAATRRRVGRSMSTAGWGWMVAASIAGLGLMWGLTRTVGNIPEPAKETTVASLEEPATPVDESTTIPVLDAATGERVPVQEPSRATEEPQEGDREEPAFRASRPATADRSAEAAGTVPPPSSTASKERPSALPQPPEPSSEEPPSAEPLASGPSSEEPKSVAGAEDADDGQDPAAEVSNEPSTAEDMIDAVPPEDPVRRGEPMPRSAEPVLASPDVPTPGPSVDAQDKVADTSSPSTMRRGDMITAEGPGVVPPQLLERPQPDYPPRARRRGIEQQVVVKVLVDEDGGVVQVIAPGADTHGFLAAARTAARDARFEPARRDGIAGRMWVNLNFDFTLD